MQLFLRIRPRRVCVLASGGVDSSVLIADLLQAGFEVYPLYVRCGFNWERAEIFYLQRLLRRIKTSKLRPLAVAEAPMNHFLTGHWGVSGRKIPGLGSSSESVYIPGRNLMLLAQAGVYCGRNKIPWITLAVLKGNPFSDATPIFLKTMEKALSQALGTRLGIVAPYRSLSKSKIIARTPDFPLELTFSCLKPRGLKRCGRCNKCEEKDHL